MTLLSMENLYDHANTSNKKQYKEIRKLTSGKLKITLLDVH